MGNDEGAAFMEGNKMKKIFFLSVITAVIVTLFIKNIEYKKYHDFLLEKTNEQLVLLIKDTFENKKIFDDMDLRKIDANGLIKLCVNSEEILKAYDILNRKVIEIEKIQMNVPLFLDSQNHLYNELWKNHINNYHQDITLTQKPIKVPRVNGTFTNEEIEYFTLQRKVNEICWKYFLTNTINLSTFEQDGEIELHEEISLSTWVEANKSIDLELKLLYEEQFDIQLSDDLFRLRDYINISSN